MSQPDQTLSREAKPDLSQILPNEFHDKDFSDALRRTIDALDVSKLAFSGDRKRANQLLVDRLGLERKVKWTIAHLFSKYFFDLFQVNGVKDGRDALDEAARTEVFLSGLSTDSGKFGAAFRPLKRQIDLVCNSLPDDVRSRFFAWRHFEDLVTEVVRPGSCTVAEDLVLYPAASSVGIYLLDSVPTTPDQVSLVCSYIHQCVQDASIEPLTGRRLPESHTAELEEMERFVNNWIQQNIPVEARST